MDKQAIESAPRYERMPDCERTPTPHLRIYKGTHNTWIEQLFEDGTGAFFWAPLPIVKEAAQAPESITEQPLVRVAKAMGLGTKPWARLSAEE